MEQVGALHGERLCFQKVSGAGPETGWVSIRVKDKQLLKTRENREDAVKDLKDLTESDTSPPLEVAASALEGAASFGAALKAVSRLDGSLKEVEAKDAPSLLLARGLLNWRLARFERAHWDLKEAARISTTAAPALLAFLLCLSKFPDALALSDLLGEKDVHALVEQWRAEAEKLSNLFFPCIREPKTQSQEIFEGVLQKDFLLHAPDNTTLGLRLLLRHEKGSPGAPGSPCIDRPLVLVFHGEDESIDTFCNEEVYEPWRRAGWDLEFSPGCFHLPACISCASTHAYAHTRAHVHAQAYARAQAQAQARAQAQVQARARALAPTRCAPTRCTPTCTPTPMHMPTRAPPECPPARPPTQSHTHTHTHPRSLHFPWTNFEGTLYYRATPVPDRKPMTGRWCVCPTHRARR